MRSENQIEGQFSFFDDNWLYEVCVKIKKKPKSRLSWDDYGISKSRYKELKKMCQSGRYAPVMRSAAHTAAKDIEGYILLSVTKNLSYEGLERLWELGEIERMPYCRTDFYGYRRLFYHLLDLEVKKGNGEINKKVY